MVRGRHRSRRPADRADVTRSGSREGRTVFRAQTARSFDLCAAARIARLWRDQGRDRQAWEFLAPVLGQFTEGFDTPDLIEARLLLYALG
jgi:hypothetical protein